MKEYKPLHLPLIKALDLRRTAGTTAAPDVEKIIKLKPKESASVIVYRRMG